MLMIESGYFSLKNYKNYLKYVGFHVTSLYKFAKCSFIKLPNVYKYRTARNFYHSPRSWTAN